MMGRALVLVAKLLAPSIAIKRATLVGLTEMVTTVASTIRAKLTSIGRRP